MNKKTLKYYFFLFMAVLSILSCKRVNKNLRELNKTNDKGKESIPNPPIGTTIPDGMIWIPGGLFNQGAIETDTLAMIHERPSHPVKVDGFFMDIHEVTNAQFSEFIKATGYMTVAEREINWEEMKKQLPQGAPRPHDSILQPGSLVFKRTKKSVPNLYDYSQWWQWKIGANWKHPQGSGSSIEGKDNFPVVHIAYEDALTYCEWAGRRLPTEAEWEYAARGNRKESLFTWGNSMDNLSVHANSWEGEFPVENSKDDGYELRAPVMSYPKNSFGLYDMAGNVWEWTSDWYNTNYYSEISNQGIAQNPTGAKQPFNPNNPYVKEKVIKGGSFLCSATYCASYRISARMATTVDSGMEHLGFRTVLRPTFKKTKNKEK